MDIHTHTTMRSDHLPILIGLQTTATSSPARHRTYTNLKKADWTRYRQEIKRKLSSRHLPTVCQKDEKLFQATLLKVASHHIQSENIPQDEQHQALYNDSLKSCRLPLIRKTSLVSPIPKPGKDPSQGTSYRPISVLCQAAKVLEALILPLLLCQAAKVLEALILPSIYKFLSPAKDQHGFRSRHSIHLPSSRLLLLSDHRAGGVLFRTDVL